MMKHLYIFIALLLATPAIAAAQGFLEPKDDIVRKEFLDKYFDRCMEVPDPHQSISSQADMCICQTIYMGESLEPREIEIMATGAGKGFVRKDVLFRDVYAPCLEFPAYDMALDKCYGDPHVRAVVSTQNAYEGTCKCVAKDSASYFRDFAQPQIAAIMTRNPILEDPLEAIFQSFEYMTSAQKSKSQCIETYQGAWDEYHRKTRKKNK